MSLKWIRTGSGEASALTPLYVATANDTVANTVTESSITGTGQGSLVVPANARVVGGRNILTAQGAVSTSGNPTIRIQLKLGSIVLADTGAQSIGNQTDGHWEITAESVPRTLGVTGTLAIAGSFMTDSEVFGFVSPSLVVIDTTAAATADVTITWGTASVSNSITMQLLSFSSVAPPA